MTRLLYILLIPLFLAASAFGTDYYVATDGSDASGDPTNIATPYLTIQNGVDDLTAGDTLYIRGGLYRENINLTYINGTAENHITITNYQSEVVNMSGGTVITGWTQCSVDDPNLIYDPDGGGDIVNPNYASIYRAVITTEDPRILEDGEYAFRCSDIDHAIGAYQDDSVFTPISADNDGQKVQIHDANHTEPDDFWNGATIKIYTRLAGNVTIERDITSFASSTFGFSALTYNLESDETNKDRYTLFNHPSLITRAGEYYYTAPDGDGNVTVYLWPLDTDNLTDKIEIMGTGSAFSGTYRPETPYGKTFTYIDIDGLDVYGYSKIVYFVDDARYTAWEAGTYSQYVGVTYDGSYYRANKETSAIPTNTDDWDLLEDTSQECHITFANCTWRSFINGYYGSAFSYLTFQDLVIRNGTTYGIYVGNAHNISIDGCTISDTGTMVLARQINIMRITNNTLTYTVPGTHANGLAIYNNTLGCSNVLVAHNIINRSELPVAMHEAVNVVFVGNFIGGTVYQWSSDEENGSLYFLNNTILGRLEAYDATPTVVSINNIRAGKYGTPDTEISVIGYDSTAAVITDEDLVDLFVDPATSVKYNQNMPWTDADYERNAGTEFDVNGVDIRPYLTTITPYFPDYDYQVDVLGAERSLTTPTIGAVEFSGDVDPGNSPPVLDAIGDKAADENKLLEFTLSATDADEDELTFSSPDLPTGSTLTDADFSWVPTYYQSGEHSVTFRVFDGTEYDAETITITVNNKPQYLLAR